MSDAPSSGGSSSSGVWSDASSRLVDLVFNFANARLAREVNPRPAAPAPLPVRPGVSTVAPYPAFYAEQNDIAGQVGEILTSPRTWLVVAGVVLVVVLVKIRR